MNAVNLMLFFIFGFASTEPNVSDYLPSTQCSPESVCEMYDICSYFLIDKIYNVKSLKCDETKFHFFDKINFPNNRTVLQMIAVSYLEKLNCAEKEYFLNLYTSLWNSKNVEPELVEQRYKMDTGKGVRIIAKRDLPEGLELRELYAISSTDLDEENNPVHRSYKTFSRIDKGLGMGPLTHINHRCEPNVIMYNKNTYCEIITTRPIKKGEEIFLDYGRNYFHDFECECDICEKRKKEIAKGKFSKIQDVSNVCSHADLSEIFDVASYFLVDRPLNISTIKVRNENLDVLKNIKEHEGPEDYLKHIDSCINKEYFLELFKLLMTSENVKLVPSPKKSHKKANLVGVTVVAKKDIPRDTELPELAGMFSDKLNRESLQEKHYNKNFLIEKSLLVGPFTYIHHRCIPNTVYEANFYSVALITSKHIKKGEEITTYKQDLPKGKKCLCDACEKIRFAEGKYTLDQLKEKIKNVPRPEDEL